MSETIANHYCGDYLRRFSGGRGKPFVLRCVVCGGPDPRPRCPHNCGPLRWTDDQWYCPQCGDEWAPELFDDPISGD